LSGIVESRDIGSRKKIYPINKNFNLHTEALEVILDFFENNFSQKSKESILFVDILKSIMICFKGEKNLLLFFLNYFKIQKDEHLSCQCAKN